MNLVVKYCSFALQPGSKFGWTSRGNLSVLDAHEVEGSKGATIRSTPRPRNSVSSRRTQSALGMSTQPWLSARLTVDFH